MENGKWKMERSINGGMFNMKHLLRSLFLVLAIFASIYSYTACSVNSTTGAGRPSPGEESSFKGPLGLQLYSLREQFAGDVPGTLDVVRKFGIENVELAGTYK